MAKYRKKPVEVEAEQFKGDKEAIRRLGLIPHYRFDRTTCTICGEEMGFHATVDTLEGEMLACPGDWIITGVEGEKCPVKPGIFAKTYEPVEQTS